MRLLNSLLGSFRSRLDRFPDKRRRINTCYGMSDFGLTAFTVLS